MKRSCKHLCIRLWIITFQKGSFLYQPSNNNIFCFVPLYSFVKKRPFIIIVFSRILIVPDQLCPRSIVIEFVFLYFNQTPSGNPRSSILNRTCPGFIISAITIVKLYDRLDLLAFNKRDSGSPGNT